ncbi:LOW QUALITY PROTEIN: GRB10-interacting GYF protein 2-like [Mercenaria mercenaria]|uniref:LOW QUALITY PROTEIN: GRB10-interacting GYF protein 2-like n=1 Tax=Mercenaria mercenaria TaxID=6596 RepID=UPI00234F08B4|nr:LOW QUALITY PROTEIN: GRB10-interacting GYF protein 2-like [Mercenaria mercenaria]
MQSLLKMADTLKFGPEWLRQLSGGNSVGTPPPSPAPGFGKYKLADYSNSKLLIFGCSACPYNQMTVVIMHPQKEVSLLQIMAQSVNSQAVLRMMGRGAPSMRGRGGGIDRGRGRGRGRGDGYMQRGVSYDEIEGGGFGRPRQRPDGSWDEGDPKAYQRSYSNRYTDPTQPNKVYQRSLSSENWRDREEDDDNGDWRRAGSKWNNSRTSWRDGTHQRGFEYDRSHQVQRGGFNRQYARQRSGENWDEEDLPEWSVDGDPDEVGTFDASGAFVSPKKGFRKEEDWDDDEEKAEKSSRGSSPPNNNKMEKGFILCNITQLIKRSISYNIWDDEEESEVPTTKQPGALPPDHENYSKWPFTSNEMAEGFSAGYFTMNLSVRRGCDEQFSPLGELIKRWGRVPFLAGPSPPPLMNSTSPDISKQQQQQQQQQEHMQAIQQQLLIQQQLVQQQMLMRHLQIQQMQQIMSQLQENEQFKSLPPLQQQQLAMQMMLKQGTPIPPAQQSQQEKLSPRSSEVPVTSSSSHPSYNRSFSTPNTSQGQNVAGSIWDIDPGTTTMPAGGITAAELENQLKEKEQQEVERKYQEMLEREKEALRKQQEEVQRQKEEIERERLEIERRKQEELKKIEEERLRAEEEKRKVEEHRRHLEEKKRKEEEQRRRMMEEEMRRQQEVERQKEIQRQQEIQEKEAERLKEQEEREKQKEQELQRRQQEDALRKQQNEALRKLQQEQLANIQLPSHAQWANSQSQMSGTTDGKSLLEIQQQEEKERLEREEVQRKQMEVQRQQMMALQQQQQQKSWTSSLSAPQGTKSLLEIQQEQARQLERERQKREENHQVAAKNMTLGSASVWGSSPPLTNWANEGAWGAIKNAQLGVNMNNNNNSNNNALGFWDDAIISTSGPVKKQSNKPSKQQTAEFPALSGDNSNRGKTAVGGPSKQKPSKSKKEEEAVQRLFQPFPQEDDFTLWCKKQLKNMATSVDIPTFIAFLQEVESPYEVHDYVRSYLGENKVTEDFARAFLEKRSQFRSKSKPAVQEDSIWGPAPAITPRELRQPTQSFNEDGQKGKANKKKKNKMMKVDASILGFTVHAAPDRIVGEIDCLETTPR